MKIGCGDAVLIVSIVSIVPPVVGVGGEAAPRQRRGERQRTRTNLMSHLEHGIPSDN